MLYLSVDRFAKISPFYILQKSQMNSFDRKTTEEDRASALKGIASVEDMLRLYKIIGKEESIYDLLKKQFAEVDAAFKKLLLYQAEFLKPVEGQKSGLPFFYVMVLTSISGALFFISKNDPNPLVQANAAKIRDGINETVIQEANPFIISFFKWDLDRRRWKHETDKLNFLKRTVQNLDEELNGQRDNLIKKYITDRKSTRLNSSHHSR